MKQFITLFLGGLVLCQAARAQCGTNPGSGTTTISTTNAIVNGYYPGTGNPAIGATSLTVGAIDNRGSLTALANGDLVLIIQMQGADINSTNSNAYGSGGTNASGYLNNANLVAGKYEYNTVSAYNSGTGLITFLYSLANNYYTRSFSGTNSIQTYQVIRVPRNYNLTINSGASVIAPAWNGSTGGVVVLDAANTMTINGTIDVSALGFRAGGGKNFDGATVGNTNGSGTLVNTDYRFNSPLTTAANTTGGAKGEGIAGTPAYTLTNGAVSTTTNAAEGYVNGSLGRGAPGNGGGGGTDGAPVGSTQNQYNTGGGGGGNAGVGGQGGSGWHGGSGNVNTYPYGGFGGSSFGQASIFRFIMGGGGGAGTANNSTGTNEYMASGGVGGGIIIARCKSFAGTGTVNANGGDAPGEGAGGATDAAGGGGAGGTIVLVISQNGAAGLSGITVNAKGGAGGNMSNYYDHGPGGGGGGGIIYTCGTLAASNTSGGVNGKTRTGNSGGPLTNDYGATSGANGTLITLGYAPPLINSNNLSSPCGTLPVKLLQFSLAVKPNGVNLSWQIDNAINFHHFEVEYSLDGRSFSWLGNVAYDNSQTNYSFFHSITSGFIYYRLKMVDINGTYAYSKVLTARLDRKGDVMLIYPNPVLQSATVQVRWNENTIATLVLMDAAGKVVDRRNVTLQNGDNILTFDTQAYSNGTYLLQLEVNNKTVASEKILKASH